MDRKLPKNQEIERLIRLGGDARITLEQEANSLKQRLDVTSRVRNSLKSNPTGWMVGSAVSGLAASLLFRRRPARPEKTDRGMAFTLGGLILTVVRPMAKVWLAGFLKNYLAAPPRVRSVEPPLAESTRPPTSFQ